MFQSTDHRILLTKIRNLLNKSGWDTPKSNNLAEYSNVALEEFEINRGNNSDFVLFLDDRAVGIIEAKASMVALSKTLEFAQKNALEYARGDITAIQNPLPFIYATDGNKILFKNLLDDLPTNEPIDKFHNPEALKNLLQFKRPKSKQTEEKALKKTNYWWVCQGKSFYEEFASGILKAPDDNIHHHKHLKELKPGDVIINYANSQIRAISTVLSSYRIDENEFIVVDVKYKTIDPSITKGVVKAIQQKNVNLFNFKYSPINLNGDINEGYLFKFNKKCYDLIFANNQDLTIEVKSSSGAFVKIESEVLGIQAQELNKTYIHSDKIAKKDLLGREIYTEAFARLITSTDVSTPIVASIFGEWGSGKSSFMHHIIKKVDKIEKDKIISKKEKFKNFILRKQIEEPKKNYFVEFNAWKYDDQDKIWAGLLQSILKEYSKNNLVKIKYFFKTLFSPSWSKLLIILIVLASIFIVPGLSLADDAKLWIFKLSDETFNLLKIFFWITLVLSIIVKGYDSYNKSLKGFCNYFKFPDYSEHLGFREEIEKDLDEILNNWLGKVENEKEREKGRLILFVDDLDRCSPKKILQVIDCIQIFLSKKGIISFIAIDHSFMDDKLEEVTNKIKMDYQYFEKIIQIPFLLPDPNNTQLYLKNLLDLSILDKSSLQEKGEKSEQKDLILQEGEENGEILQEGEEDTILQEDGEEEKYLLTSEDKDALLELNKHLPKNPRQIKRFINIYILSRYFLCNSIECVKYNPKLLAAWLLICCKHNKVAEEIKENVLIGKNPYDILKEGKCISYNELKTTEKNLIINFLNSPDYSLKEMYIKITDCFLFG